MENAPLKTIITSFPLAQWAEPIQAAAAAVPDLKQRKGQEQKSQGWDGDSYQFNRNIKPHLGTLVALYLDDPSTPTPDSLLAPGRLPPIATFLLCLSDSFKFTCQHNLESNSRSRGLMKSKCVTAHNSSQAELRTQPCHSLTYATLAQAERGAVGENKKSGSSSCMLSLNFSGKACRGVVREISWDARLWGRRHIQSRQVDLWVTSLETVIEVSCGFRYCMMWSKNLSLSPASSCDSL